MRSNGGVMTPEVATERPVAMMESGPVGGIIASARVGEALGFDNVISFDMGGTTAKASLVRDGEPTLAPGYYVGGYASGHPVMLPMIDVVEVGAGGGSIAWIDDVGALKVGPQSAGADPGPSAIAAAAPSRPSPMPMSSLAASTRRIFSAARWSSTPRRARRHRAKDRKAAEAGRRRGGASHCRNRDPKMSLAVREVSVEKGYDPRDFVLVASGGAGPLHVCAIARELHIPKVIVPLFPSHFSALGMLLADERHDFIRTFYYDFASLDFAELIKVHDEMAAEAKKSLRNARNAEFKTELDLRYVGQEFTLSVPVSREMIARGDRQKIRKAFDALYEHRYAHHSPDEPVEMVNIRLAGIGKRPRLKFPKLPKAAGKAARRRDVYLSDARKAVSCPIYQRADLGAGARIKGPALIEEHGTTTVLFEPDSCTVARSGELLIDVGGAK